MRGRSTRFAGSPATSKRSTEAWQGVTSAGATAEWKAEAAEAADASPTLAAPSIPVHFGDAFVPYSFEVGMDALNFAAELQGVLLDAAEQLMATAYTTGTGTGQPTGIITALVGTSSLVASAGADVFARADVYAVQNALPARFSANGPVVRPHRDHQRHQPYSRPPPGRAPFPEVSEGRLLNKPLNELSNMDGVVNAAQENYILLYGDFQHFVIADRIGTTLELIPNMVGASRRPTGQRGALLWFRTGSDYGGRQRLPSTQRDLTGRLVVSTWTNLRAMVARRPARTGRGGGDRRRSIPKTYRPSGCWSRLDTGARRCRRVSRTSA